jgi:hypothetical protein
VRTIITRSSWRDIVTDTAIATNASTIVEAYFAMWNETDAARRRAAIERAWTPDASYLDPMFAAEGADGLDALVAGVHQQYPGHRFRLTDPVDAHHDRARWGWEFVGPDGGTPIAAGVDFAMLAPDGRLRQVTGFFAAPAQPA